MGDITSNLVLHWAVDNNTLDSSSQGNDGTFNGTPSYQNGQIGQALSFNGTTEYLADASTTGFPASNGAFTMSAWINATALSSTGDNVFFMFGPQVTAQGPHFTIRNTRIRFAIWGGGVCVWTTTVTTGTWYHVVGVFNGTVGALYVSNTLRQGSVAMTYTAAGTIPVRAGGATQGLNFQAGLMDDIRVYSRALVADDIADLFNYTGAPQSIAAASAYYRMMS